MVLLRVFAHYQMWLIYLYYDKQLCINFIVLKDIFCIIQSATIPHCIEMYHSKSVIHFTLEV
jgi:hypothetical protein